MRGSSLQHRCCCLYVLFQFTPLHERQQFLPLVRQIAFPYFNSRLYMRGSFLLPLACHTILFQFTPLHERQQLPLTEMVPKIISIHASTWEAAFNANVPVSSKRFQFTPLHERQRVDHWSVLLLYIFQFTPLHERQRRVGLEPTYPKIFQFTPLHERQLKFKGIYYAAGEISIHASTWEAAYFED